ncbi:MAG: glycosyltransferase family 2 protein [Cyclobacteriaceae bacterium]
MKDFLVTVVVWTYNHGEFIEEALNGIINQQRDFELEVIVGDDFSTDGAREIITGFSEKYSFIKPLLPDRNYGPNENVKQTLLASRGKYIAFLDGDDYWCDNFKLQKQVDFMERNNEVNLCFNNVRIIGRGEAESMAYLPSRKKYIDCYDLIQGDFTHTNATIVRNSKGLFDPVINNQLPGSDTVLFLLPLIKGGVGYFFSEIMSVYRVHRGGVFSMKSVHQRYKQGIKDMSILKEYFNDKKFKSAFLKARADMYLQYSIEFAMNRSLLKFIFFHVKFVWVSLRRLDFVKAFYPYYVFIMSFTRRQGLRQNLK